MSFGYGPIVSRRAVAAAAALFLSAAVPAGPGGCDDDGGVPPPDAILPDVGTIDACSLIGKTELEAILGGPVEITPGAIQKPGTGGGTAVSTCEVRPAKSANQAKPPRPTARGGGKTDAKTGRTGEAGGGAAAAGAAGAAGRRPPSVDLRVLKSPVEIDPSAVRAREAAAAAAPPADVAGVGSVAFWVRGFGSKYTLHAFKDARVHVLVTFDDIEHKNEQATRDMAKAIATRMLEKL